MRGLAEFFESAQKLGIIRADVPPALLLSLVYGSVWQMARLEWINKRYFDRAFMSVEERQNTFDMLFKILCDGFLAKDSLLSLI